MRKKREQIIALDLIWLLKYKMIIVVQKLNQDWN